jgi:hypothetical protein
MKLSDRSRSSAVLLAAMVVCLAHTFFAPPAQAAPLNLTSTHPGDVASFFTYVEYTLDADPNTGTFTAQGYAMQLDVNNQNINNGTFDLSMTVLRATGGVVGGTVSISGDTDGVPFYSGLLLEGDIMGFGFQDPPINPGAGEGNIFEFQVHVTDGALHAPYYVDDWAGIILTFNNPGASPPFTGVFTSPFANDFTGFSDTFPITDPNIPEPSSIVLLGMGVLPLAWRLRRRFRSHAT